MLAAWATPFGESAFVIARYANRASDPEALTMALKQRRPAGGDGGSLKEISEAKEDKGFVASHARGTCWIM